MLIQCFSCPPIETNTYLIACESSREAAVIDPGLESYEHVQASVKEHQLTLSRVLLTHSHWDHIVEAATFNKEIPVYVHPLDASNVLQPGSDGLSLPLPIKGCTSILDLEEGKKYSLGNLTFTVIHTPGHSKGSVCLYFESEKTLFSGDTLFQGTYGKITLPTSQPELMGPSLKRLALLPPSTIVYPGHGPATQIGHETWLNTV